MHFETKKSPYMKSHDYGSKSVFFYRFQLYFMCVKSVVKEYMIQ